MKNYIIAALGLICLTLLIIGINKKPVTTQAPTQVYTQGKTDTVTIYKDIYRKVYVYPDIKKDTFNVINSVKIDTIVYDDKVIVTAFSRDILTEPLEIAFYNKCENHIINRVDTLKKLEYVEVEKPQPFYNSFWFGSAVTAAAGVTALIFLK